MAFLEKSRLPSLLRALGAAVCIFVLLRSTEATADRAPSWCRWLIGLTQSGSAGLFDLPLADPGCPWQLRLGVFAHGFTQSNFLFIGDRNDQLNGTVALSATLGAYVETWFTVDTRTNRNQHSTNESGATIQPTLALGRTALGVKLHGALGRFGHLALLPTVRVHSGPFDFGPNFSSVDAGIDLLSSLDLGGAWPWLPLRLSARIGYLHDRSASVLSLLECMAQGGTECLATRLIYTTAYDIGQPRVILGFGADAHFRIGEKVLLGPTASYTLQVVASEGDAVLLAQLGMQAPAVSLGDVNARVAQTLSLGAKLVLPFSLSIDLGMQVALSSFGYAMGPRPAQIAGYGALSFALDLGGGAAGGVRTGDGASPLPSAAASFGTQMGSARLLSHAAGQVRGVVRDAQTQAPLADAFVRFIGVPQNALLTDEHGSYASGPLPVGPLTVEASRGDHQTARTAVVVRAGETTAANLELLTMARTAPAILWVELRDETNATPAAIATLSRPLLGQGAGRAQAEIQSIEMSPQPHGHYARLSGGSWRLRIDAAGYLSREQIVVLSAGTERRLSLRLVRRPALPRVRLIPDEIALAEPLSFVGDALHPQLTPASLRLLDEVSDLLIHHLELRQIRIETVGAGTAAQLIAVRDYLVQAGTAPERVIAGEALTLPPHDRAARIVLRIVR